LKISLLVLLIAGVITFSLGTELEYEFQNVDKFTGARNYQMQPIRLHNKFKFDDGNLYRDLSLDIAYLEGVNILHLNYDFRLGSIFQMMGNTVYGAESLTTSLTILLEDGHQITVPSGGAVTEVDNSKTMSHPIVHSFILTQDDIAILKRTTITDIRVSAMYRDVDIEVPEETREDVKALFEYCTVQSEQQGIDIDGGIQM